MLTRMNPAARCLLTTAFAVLAVATVRYKADGRIEIKDADSAVLRAKLDGRHKIRPPAGQKITQIRRAGQPVKIKTDDGAVVEFMEMKPEE